MRTLIAALLLSTAAFAQTASFPSSVATSATNFKAGNNVGTTTTVAQSISDTTLTVASSAGIVAPMLISVGVTRPEIEAVCLVSGNTLTIGYNGTCPSLSGRGFDGTSAASHLSGVPVNGNIVAWHRNKDAAEIAAIETALGPNLSNIPTGPQGPAGATGAQGSQGIQGIQGIQGAAGADGANGTNGLNGAGSPSYISSLISGPVSSGTLTGATHGYVASGCPLLVGFRDNASPQNAITASWTVAPSTCDVAYSFASPQSNFYVIVNGATGVQGAAGSNGSAGATGAQGPAGANGAAGAQGPAGPAGANGANGATGATGAAGAAGATGPTGATGATGPAGPAGAAGTTTWRGAYSAGTTYAQGDGVSSSGVIYLSLVNSNIGNTPASSPTYWVSQAGGTGVTNLATTGPITGGPITASGTIGCATCVTSSASLTANQLLLGGGSQASTPLGSLGTTSTVMHGNASGPPSFGAVALASEVSGVLPPANGGTGSVSGTQTQVLRIQPNTGNNTTYQFAAPSVLVSSDYAFPAQSPGGSLGIG